jgi:bifunctional DNA-binding transcriptional regulator/antitoxin component of YhaV-PrlF toxin-antitoxin module
VNGKIWKKHFCDQVDSVSFTAISDDRGRITIPASVRQKMKIRTGFPILLKIEKILRRGKDEG